MSFSSEEQKVYNAIFTSLDKEQLGIVTGEASRSTFEKSQLSPSILGEIWQLSDPTNLGFLNQYGFYVALRLVGHAQSGRKPEKSLIETPGPIPKFAETPKLTENSTPTSINHQQTSSASSLQPQLTSLPPLSNSDISKFSQLFFKSSFKGFINGEQAREIFLKAKLPTSTLSQIWSLSDVHNRGSLNRDEFVVAMFLIQGTINGSIKQLPPVIPSSIWDQLKTSSNIQSFSSQASSPQATKQQVPKPISRVPSSFANASNDWVISPQKREQFDNIFEGLDKDSRHVLGPGEVAPFLITSKLSQDVLASIWDLADIHNTGEFTKDEFAIAMFLVQKRIAGAELPHVVPDSLLPSHLQSYGQPPTQEKQASQDPSGAPQFKSSLNDLVDLNDAFSTPSPSIEALKSSPVTPALALPTTHTGTYQPKPFVPTSSFGQGIVKENTGILEEKSPVPAPSSVTTSQQTSSQVISNPQPQQISSYTQSKSGTTALPKASSPLAGTFNRSINDDLFTDSNPEISGKLSQATSDIANLSNQIGSLTTQTSQLHEKRTRAERELAKITGLKNDIEGKLSKLRVAYTQEVKQTEEVERLLQSSKVETEELRKEASVAEAQYNETQLNLQRFQNELEESQKENSALKEQLGTINAEHIESTKELEKIQSEVKQSKGWLAINSQQLSDTELKSSHIKDEIEKLLSSSRELDTHHESYLQKRADLETLKSEIEQSEQALKSRKLQHEESEGAFQSKSIELEQRLADQQQNELAIQNQEERVQQLWSGLQERQRQFEIAEQQLQQQQIDYAQRIQEFSNKQINDATWGFSGSTSTTAQEIKEVESHPEETEKSSSPGNSEISGAAIGLAAGAIGSTAVAATSTTATNADEVERANTEFSSQVATTEQSNITPSEDYQANNFNQFGHLDIQRPESATSSVVNNPPQSVRGDDVDIESETLGETANEEEPAALASDVLSKDYNKDSALRNQVYANDESSPGAGSFEIVDDHKSEDDLTIKDSQVKEPTDNIPGSWNVETPEIDIKPQQNYTSNVPEPQKSEEFPPIQELNITESDSEDEFHESSADASGHVEDIPGASSSASADVTTANAAIATSSDNNDFDFEAKSASIPKVPIPPKSTQPKFDDIDEIEESKDVEEDEFDAFDGLEAAEADEDDEDFSKGNELAHDIEESSFYGAEAAHEQPQASGSETQDNDEWEQIFAGFGNQSQAHPTKSSTRSQENLVHPTPQKSTTSTSNHKRIATTPRSLAVQELTGMGFSEEEALSALQKEKWNLEAATNYLLDNA